MPSATVPTASQSESDVLDVRAEVWRKRPLLRTIYNRYFAEMLAYFATTPRNAEQGPRPADFGIILELGGGSGNFKEYFLGRHTAASGGGTLIASDVVPTLHCDLAADAQQLPFPDDSLDNIVLQDVLHHIPFPLRFFAEAQRTLRPGGRIIMTEPYISAFSRLVFKLAHPEPVDMKAHIFAASGPDPSPLRGTGAFDSNQATPTLLFFRDRARFQERFPRLAIRQRLLRSLLVYPLSGGFSGPKLLPRFAEPLAWTAEKCLTPLASLMAFRLLVVIEKRADSDSD